MNKKLFTDSCEEQSYTNSEHYKSLLRVRGIEAVEQEILKKESELEEITREARLYYEVCMKVNLVTNVTYLSKKVNYQYMDKPGKFHVPFLVFSSQIPLKHGIGRFQRKDHYNWEEVSKMLDNCNASLDERLMHMKVFFAFKDFYFRARQVAEDLRVLYRLKFEFNSMLNFEHMSSKDLPRFMRQSLIS